MLLLFIVVVVVCDKLSTAELYVMRVHFPVLLFKVETVLQIKLEQLFVYLENKLILFYCSSV